MLKNFEFKLTQEEVVEAIGLWLQEKKCPEHPLDATHRDEIWVGIETGDYDTPVAQQQPLVIKWSVLDGDEP